MKIAKILFEGKTCYGKLENGMVYPISGDLFGSFTVGGVGIPLEKAKLLGTSNLNWLNMATQRLKRSSAS